MKRKKDVTDDFFKTDPNYKRGNGTDLKDELLHVLQINGLDSEIKKHLVFKNWEKIVGEKISEHARPDHISGDILFIKVDNPAWKTELSMLYTTLNERIQKATRYEIKKIRII